VAKGGIYMTHEQAKKFIFWHFKGDETAVSMSKM
jgi:hypothetical protein